MNEYLNKINKLKRMMAIMNNELFYDISDYIEEINEIDIIRKDKHYYNVPLEDMDCMSVIYETYAHYIIILYDKYKIKIVGAVYNKNTVDKKQLRIMEVKKWIKS